MYAYFIGTIEEITDHNLILEVNHIGYNIRITDRATVEVEGISDEVKIYTYTYVKEDALQLYGFLSKDEISLFQQMLQVSGIGPKGAMAILSLLNPDSLRVAIISSDVKSIAAASGIGKKTAERLILELKDKVFLEDVGFIQETAAKDNAGISNAQHDAVEALTALGYSAADALRAVRSVKLEEDDVEMILKTALKKM